MRYWSVLLVTMALCCVSCANCGSENATCGTADDCAEGQICEDGVCQEPEENFCEGDPDCPGGFVCIANQCERRDEIDMSDGNNEVDMSDNNRVDMGSDMEFDNIPPEVVAVSPEDATTDVALDTSVTVEFSEPMRATTINVQSIEIRNPANERVPADVTYDEATMTATLTPQAPLRQATPFRLVATQFVRDEAGNELVEEFESRFYTTYEEPTGITEVAETWAPYIYQNIQNTDGGGPNADIPTRVDFDSNLKARDNKSKAKLNSTKTDATVYYSVIESKTHYFITYSMYYPVRTTLDNEFEHDFTGMVIVVDKATDTLALAEGVRVQEGEDVALGFIPNGSEISGTLPQEWGFDANLIEDGTHFPMFVTSGVHEACMFPIEGTVPYCLHNDGEFPDTGVLLKPGDTGQTYDDRDTNTDPEEMTYELVPLPATLWTRRTDVGSEELWQQTIAYTPIGQDRPAMTTGGWPIILPNRLFSDDDKSFGKPPFQFLRTSTESNGGQWLIDPAYLLLNRYTVGQLDWSNEYCFNVFLDLNLRGDAANPECDTDA